MNEFAHLLSRTDGNIKCAVGPFQTSLSQQETPVIFNTKTKRFEECDDYEKAKQEAYAATVERIFGAITPDLTAAMNNKANAELTAVIAESMSPYAIASVGESVSDVTRKLLRGTTLEEVVGNLPQIVNK